MSKLFHIVSATIVLIFFTGPVHAQTPSSENLAIAPAPQSKSKAPPPEVRYYPYHQSLTIKAGEEFGLAPLELENGVFALEYQLPEFLSPRYEIGAEIEDDNTGDVYFGFRKTYRERTYFRPSWRLALDNAIDPNKNLATFVDIDNYYLRASAAVDCTFWRPWSLRLEAESLFGVRKTRAQVLAGITLGW